MCFAHIHRAASGVAVAACCTVASAAIAGGIADREGMILRWTCMQQYDKSFNARCIPRIDGASPGAFPVRGAALFWEDILGQPHATWRAVRLIPDTRPVAMRSNDEIFSGKAWYVPLHSRPTDPANVMLVLQSALCGARTYCRVTYRLDANRREDEE